jgi:Icc-related predicted phosphoesterase
MKVVCIADTHCYHNKIDVPDGDLLIVAGDFSVGIQPGNIFEAENFNRWLCRLPHGYKILVAGNHDWLAYDLKDIPENIQRIYSAAIYLQDSMVKIEGIKIYGSPWQPYFNNWAFNLPRDGPELAEKWKLIPEGIDILVTHTPPYNILDMNQEKEHCGCKLLSMNIGRVKPRYHIFGHLHDGYGMCKEGETTFINASVLDDEYRIKHKALVFEI